MRLTFLSYVLIFVLVLGTCGVAEFINNHQWKDILPYLNAKYFQRTRPSLMATTHKICAQHFQIYMDQISVSDWAMQMFDSSTKFPESVLMGQSVYLGNFDECVGVENVQTEVGPFSGQHCLVAFQGKPSSLMRSLVTHNQQSTPDFGGFRGHIRDMTGNSRTIGSTGTDGALSLSYCIPSTCSARDFEEILNSYLRSMNFSVVATANEQYCQTNEGRKLGTEDWVTVGVFIVIVLLAAASTAYDVIVTGPKKEVLTAFSIYSNGKKLLSTKSPADTLHSLHGIRFITVCWVVWGHRYTVDAAVPSINFNTVADFVKDASRLYITNGTLSADTFLVLSGLLVSYVFFMKHNSSGFNIPLYYLHRYIRLTPPYAIVILFNATLYRHVATGPLLPAITGEMAKNCQNYWWTNILYINNYVRVDHMCMGQSWYLSVDMQLFLLSPLILYPLWKWPLKWNILLLGILSVAGAVSPFTISNVSKLSADLLYGNADRVRGQDELYLATHSRFGPWVIGVAFGYIIYETKRRELKFSVMQIVMGWILSNVALLGSLNGAYSFYQPDADKTVLESAFYNGLFRNVWAFGVGVTIFMCEIGYGGAANMLLCWKVFPLLSRLSYCVYLTHASYQITQSFSRRTPNYIADLTEWPAFFADVIISLIMAAILSLCIEAPARNLEKCLLKTGRREPQNEAEETPAGSSEENAYESMEQGKDLEDENRNFTEVKVGIPWNRTSSENRIPRDKYKRRSSTEEQWK